MRKGGKVLKSKKKIIKREIGASPPPNLHYFYLVVALNRTEQDDYYLRVAEPAIDEEGRRFRRVPESLVGVVEHDERPFLVAKVVELVQDSVLPQHHYRQAASGDDVARDVLMASFGTCKAYRRTGISCERRRYC